MKRLLFLAAAVLMAACSAGDTPTPPAAKPTPKANRDEITCRSGYIVAFDENGNPYCAPETPLGGTSFRSPAIVKPDTTKKK